MSVGSIHGAKKGKKHRKYGRNIRKLAHSGRTTWGLMEEAKRRKQRRAAQRRDRLQRIASTRICSKCMHVGFPGRRELIRHELRCKGVAA